MNRLEGKVVIITGASGGLGKQMALRFAQEGAKLAICARREKKLQETKDLCQQAGAQVLAMVADVSHHDELKAFVEKTAETLGTIDVLVNNAGLALGLDKEFEGDIDEWSTMIDTNLKGLLTMTRLVVPHMVERNHGHVINIGSVAGDQAYAGGNVYCATKAAVKALSDGLRIDLVDTCVRVTNVKPGLVETNFSVTRFRGDKSKADSVYAGIHPLNGDDIADVLLYAANSPEHVQIAEVLVLATHQANGYTFSKDTSRVEHLS